jgi:hypothetical protein
MMMLSGSAQGLQQFCTLSQITQDQSLTGIKGGSLEMRDMIRTRNGIKFNSRACGWVCGW